MPRIAVVTSSPPMVEGGHMVIARSLTQALRDAGHDADIIVTPQNRFGRQASAYLATWLTDVGSTDGRRIDQVISLRYPSYAVRHEKHVCWLNHTMREYYDLWERFSGTLGRRGLLKARAKRTAIHAADRYLLGRNVQKLFVQSKTIQQRLAIWPEVRSTVLYPPAPQRPYRCDGYGDYIFIVEAFASRKAVVTCADSGGPAELVANEVNGFVCDPRPESLASALRKLTDDAAMGERMGSAAFDTGAELNWADAVRRLTA